MIKSEEYYINLITSEYQNSPNFLKWVKIYIDHISDATNVLNIIDNSFYIDDAVGNQLDILGVILGRGRTVNFQPTDMSSSTLTDEYYRMILKAKIIINVWDGTIPSLMAMWNSLFPANEIVVHDNQDMTMDVIISGSVPLTVKDLVKYGYIIPKPQSVGINYYFSGDAPMFGYDLENKYIKGYDEGLWAISEKETLFGYDSNDLGISGYDQGAW